MTTCIELILINTIWCLGVTIVTQDGMALYSIREWAESKESKWMNPVIICEWCIPSLHSFFGYAIGIGIGVISNFSWSLVFMWPLVVMGSSFLTGVLWAVYKLIEVKTEYFRNIETLTYFDVKDRKEEYQKKNKN